MRRAWVSGLLAVTLGGEAQAQFTSPPKTDAVLRPSWRVVVSDASRTAPSREQADIHERIRDGVASGQLTRREARRLRQENGQLGVLAERYGSDGLSDAEARELQTRAIVLRDQVDAQRLGAGSGPKRP